MLDDGFSYSPLRGNEGGSAPEDEEGERDGVLEAERERRRKRESVLRFMIVIGNL